MTAVQVNGIYIFFENFALDNEEGAGGISYYRVMPTYHNPSGNKAYIMNMYTNPAISLETTDMGRPLYEKFGFVKMNDEMELPERRWRHGRNNCITGEMATAEWGCPVKYLWW